MTTTNEDYWRRVAEQVPGSEASYRKCMRDFVTFETRKVDNMSKLDGLEVDVIDRLIETGVNAYGVNAFVARMLAHNAVRQELRTQMAGELDLSIQNLSAQLKRYEKDQRLRDEKITKAWDATWKAYRVASIKKAATRAKRKVGRPRKDEV